MSIKKIDKKIINNEKMPMPQEGTLDSAMSEISNKKKKPFAWRKFLPIMASCVVVIAVLAMIPAMIPANSAEPYIFVSVEDMQIEVVDSVKEYYENQDIKHFSQQPTDAKLYKYDDKNCFAQEIFDMNGVTVDYILQFDTYYYYRFAVSEDFLHNLNGGNYEYIGNYVILYRQEGDVIYAHISSDLEYEYMLTMDFASADTANIGDWKNIIEELLN